VQARPSHAGACVDYSLPPILRHLCTSVQVCRRPQGAQCALSLWFRQGQVWVLQGVLSLKAPRRMSMGILKLREHENVATCLKHGLLI
jgi:hypothetical protein